MHNIDDIEELKKSLEKDTSLSDDDREKMMRQAKIVTKISDAFKESEMEPVDMLRLLTHLTCGLTHSCDDVYSAIGLMHTYIAESFQYLGALKDNAGEPNEDKD